MSNTGWLAEGEWRDGRPLEMSGRLHANKCDAVNECETEFAERTAGEQGLIASLWVREFVDGVSVGDGTDVEVR